VIAAIFILILVPFALAQIPEDPQDCLDNAEKAGLRFRGDADFNGVINIGDAVYILNYLFKGGDPSHCPQQSDANNDERVDISDAVIILKFLFQGSGQPAEIDLPPYLGMPPEVKIQLDEPSIFAGWSTDNFQGDLVSCISKAKPLSKKGDPIELLSFQTTKDNPIVFFADEIQTVVSPKGLPSGKYEVRTTCKDVKDHEGITLTDLTVTSATDTDGDGRTDPEFDTNCVNDQKAGLPEEEQQRFDVCCKRSADPVTACVKSNQNNQHPDCGDTGLAGDFEEVPIDDCNQEQGEGGTVVVEPPETYCRVKCVAVFHNKGTAECGKETINLADEIKNFREGAREGYDNEDKAWDLEKQGLPRGIGPNSGEKSSYHLRVNREGKIRDKTKTKEEVNVGYGFFVFAKYVGVDENLKEVGEGNGKACKEYQFVQSTMINNNVLLYKSASLFPYKSFNELYGTKSNTLNEFWENENRWRGTLLPMNEVIKKQSQIADVVNVPGHSRIDKRCSYSGPAYCSDDYFQTEGDDDYTLNRESPRKVQLINGDNIEIKNALHKHFIGIGNTKMIYWDNIGLTIGKGKIGAISKNNNFFIVVEDQAVGGTVNHKIVCWFAGVKISLTSNQDGSFTSSGSSDGGTCIELQNKDNEWYQVSKWDF